MDRKQAISILKEMAAANRRQAEAIDLLLKELGEGAAGGQGQRSGGLSLEKPYTPETLAEYWGCTSRHVREEIKRERLVCFRVGSLIRITTQAVRDYEAKFGRRSKQEGGAL